MASLLKRLFFIESGGFKTLSSVELLFVKIVNSILNLAIFTCGITSFYHFFTFHSGVAAHNIFLMFVFSIPKLLLKKGQIWSAIFIFQMMANLVLYAYSAALGESRGLHLLLLIPTVIPFLMGINYRTFFFSTCSVLTVSFLFYSNFQNYFDVHLEQSAWNYSVSYVLTSLALILVMVILQKHHQAILKAFDEERVMRFNASKIASLTELSAAIAHEFNNPLMVLSGKTELMIRKLQNESYHPEQLEKDLSVLQQSTKRMANLIDSMCRLLGSQPGKDVFRLQGWLSVLCFFIVI